MAAAMVEGLIAKGAYKASQIACLGGSGKSGPALSARCGIRLAASLEDLLGGADTLVVAFKPKHLASADPRLRVLSEGQLVISVLAGKKLDALERANGAKSGKIREKFTRVEDMIAALKTAA